MQIATEACLFVSMLLLRVTASHKCRTQLGDGNFINKCYQMALFKNSSDHFLPLYRQSASGAVKNRSEKFDNQLCILKTSDRFETGLPNYRFTT